jgi:hypothetical protein
VLRAGFAHVEWQPHPNCRSWRGRLGLASHRHPVARSSRPCIPLASRGEAVSALHPAGIPWRGRLGLASHRHPASGKEQGQDALATWGWLFLLLLDLVNQLQRLVYHYLTGPFGEIGRTSRLVSALVISGAVADIPDSVVAERYNKKLL